MSFAEQFVDMKIQEAMSKLHTIIIGVVDRYDEATHTADVQPMYKEIIDGKEIPLPMLTNVILSEFRTPMGIFRMSVQQGDIVTVALSEMPIDDIDTKLIHTPRFDRRFSLNDAIIIAHVGRLNAGDEPTFTAAGVKVQYSVDGATLWHNVLVEADRYIRFSIDDGATWSVASKFVGDDAPTVLAQYSVDGVNTWHATWVAADLYIRFSVDGGVTWSAAMRFVGPVGAYGQPVGAKWNFRTDTAGVPIVGEVKFNNATPASVTQIKIYETDKGGYSQVAWMNTWDDSGSASKGRLEIHLPGVSDSYMVFDVTAIVDSGSYRTLTVAFLGGKTTVYADAVDCFIEFVSTGDKGDPGTAGSAAPAVKIQYSVNGSTSWHDTYAGTDLYCRFSTDNGSTWSAAMKFIGDDGAPGAAGPNQVNTTTASNITGMLKGTGSLVAVAVDGTDYLSGPTAIPSSANLNTYTTPGMYYCASNATVATLTNCPVIHAFSLFVEKHAGVKQTLTEYMNDGTALTMTRNSYSGTFETWKMVWDARTDGAGSGLDADLLQNAAPDTAASANSIVKRNASGYIFAVIFNSSYAADNYAAVDYYYDSGDGYMRKKTLANVRAEIVTAADILSKIAGGSIAGALTMTGLTVNGTASLLGAVIIDADTYGSGTPPTGTGRLFFKTS